MQQMCFKFNASIGDTPLNDPTPFCKNSSVGSTEHCINTSCKYHIASVPSEIWEQTFHPIFFTDMKANCNEYRATNS